MNNHLDKLKDVKKLIAGGMKEFFEPNVPCLLPVKTLDYYIDAIEEKIHPLNLSGTEPLLDQSIWFMQILLADKEMHKGNFGSEIILDYYRAQLISGDNFSEFNLHKPGMFFKIFDAHLFSAFIDRFRYMKNKYDEALENHPDLIKELESNDGDYSTLFKNKFNQIFQRSHHRRRNQLNILERKLAYYGSRKDERQNAELETEIRFFDEYIKNEDARFSDKVEGLIKYCDKVIVPLHSFFIEYELIQTLDIDNIKAKEKEKQNSENMVNALGPQFSMTTHLANKLRNSLNSVHFKVYTKLRKTHEIPGYDALHSYFSEKGDEIFGKDRNKKIISYMEKF